jgi:hypothetical protein
LKQLQIQETGLIIVFLGGGQLVERTPSGEIFSDEIFAEGNVGSCEALPPPGETNT